MASIAIFTEVATRLTLSTGAPPRATPAASAGPDASGKACLAAQGEARRVAAGRLGRVFSHVVRLGDSARRWLAGCADELLLVRSQQALGLDGTGGAAALPLRDRARRRLLLLPTQPRVMLGARIATASWLAVLDGAYLWRCWPTPEREAASRVATATAA